MGDLGRVRHFPGKGGTSEDLAPERAEEASEHSTSCQGRENKNVGNPDRWGNLRLIFVNLHVAVVGWKSAQFWGL
jgi:hypothetical protein